MQCPRDTNQPGKPKHEPIFFAVTISTNCQRFSIPKHVIQARYEARDRVREGLEFLAGAALARYAATTPNGAARVLAERISAELLQRAADRFGVKG